MAYVGFHNKDTDASLPDSPFPEDLSVIPYKDAWGIINGFAARSFIENWTGFAPEINYAFASHPEVKEMPCYPDQGSIKVIDDVLVVKFS